MAARQVLGSRGRIRLVASSQGVLSGFGVLCRRVILRRLKRASVDIVNTVAAVKQGELRFGNAAATEVNTVLLATGATAPPWLSGCGLALDRGGVVQVDQFYRSVSHANVFAAGDICSRVDMSAALSGVRAVRAGPVLAANLLAAMTGWPMRPHQPRRRVLSILASGGYSAVAAFGPFCVAGRWVWRWKDAIDRHFVRRFRCGDQHR